MADTKITALTAISTVDPAVDVLPIVDVSDTTMAASGTTKKITSNQILGAGGTATLASATITGDLTVDTSTLKVNSSLNRVGIQNASPSTILHVGSGSGGNDLGILLSRGATSNFFEAYDGTKSFIAGTDSGQTAVKVGSLSNHSMFLVCNNTTQLQIDPLGVFTFTDGAGGTRMTLNSTGLGVGVSPAYKLDVSSSSNIVGRVSSSSVLNTGFNIANTTGSTWSLYSFGSNDATLQNSFGIYHQNGTSFLQITQAGNVGVGVTPSAWAAGYKAIQIAASQSTALMGSGNQTELTTNAFFDGAWKYQGAGTVAASRYSQQSGVHYWYSAAAGAAGTAIGSGFTNAAMTLDASGRLLVGSTSNPAYDGFRGFFYNNGNNTLISQCDSANYCLLLYTGNGTNAGSAAAFKYGATTVGTIQTTASSTAYNTSSDYRLKESVQPMTGALNRVIALKPSTYKWKVDGSSGEGFIAHELAQVVPLAVTGEKDAVNEDGSIKAQGVDLSKVVPVLVAAIQEIAAEVNALKNA